MPNKSILIIHPYDRTTFFLKRISNFLQIKKLEGVHYFNVKPNDSSHNDCLDKIKKHPKGGLIIFLGHGQTNQLYGSKSDNYSEFIEDSTRTELSEVYYYKENFIDSGNIDVFRDKKVYCLTCNSNSKISDFAVEQGAITFLGFGDIPTSIGEFKERGKNVGNDIVKAMKTEINYIIKHSLLFALVNNYTFIDLVDITNFITNQRISTILTEQKWFRERYLLSDYLYYLKREIKIKGDKHVRLLG